MKHFIVTWTIDAWSNTPEEAIAKAILDMPHPQRDEESLATFFSVEEVTETGNIEHGIFDTETFEGEQRKRFLNVLDGDDEDEDEDGQDRESYTDEQDRKNYTV
jgi:hypothetical protein